jgi:hypothetical protein
MGPKKNHHAKRRATARHDSFLRHKNFRWFRVAVILVIISIVSYFWIDVAPRHNGGSWYGYTLGTISALLIVWLAMLGIRKRAMTAGRWSLKAWTSAHVYLGLSLIIIGTLHTGFQFAWNVHLLAYLLMMAVILSGLFGIYYYVRLPKLMSDNRGETGQAEMLEEIAALDRRLRDVAAPLQLSLVNHVEDAINKTRLGGGIFRRLAGKDAKCATTRAVNALREAADQVPDEQKEAMQATIALLSRKQIMLNRVRRHLRFKTLLELWLYFHVPLTLALLAALTAHVISVFFYW